MRMRSAPFGDMSMAVAERSSLPVSARATVKLRRQAQAKARMWVPSSTVSEEPLDEDRVESGAEARSRSVSNIASITDPESCNCIVMGLMADLTYLACCLGICFIKINYAMINI